mmetsp:Transcript_5189/g.23355  ORF Transcript_5189/g.23355 Transcript_5189/m.23355 type:complete len:353 (-) Transcript_5189:1010-2068(-)
MARIATGGRALSFFSPSSASIASSCSSSSSGVSILAEYFASETGSVTWLPTVFLLASHCRMHPSAPPVSSVRPSLLRRSALTPPPHATVPSGWIVLCPRPCASTLLIALPPRHSSRLPSGMPVTTAPCVTGMSHADVLLGSDGFRNSHDNTLPTPCSPKDIVMADHRFVAGFMVHCFRCFLPQVQNRSRPGLANGSHLTPNTPTGRSLNPGPSPARPTTLPPGLTSPTPGLRQFQTCTVWLLSHATVTRLDPSGLKPTAATDRKFVSSGTRATSSHVRTSQIATKGRSSSSVSGSSIGFRWPVATSEWGGYHSPFTSTRAVHTVMHVMSFVWPVKNRWVSRARSYTTPREAA